MKVVDTIFINEKVHLFTLNQVADKLGIFCDIFEMIAEKGINLLLVMMSSSTQGKVDFNFLVQDSEANDMKLVLNEIAERLGGGKIGMFENASLLTLTGENLARIKGVAFNIVDSLARAGVKLLSASSSSHSISCIIPRDKTNFAKEILKASFGFNKEEIF